MSWKIFFDSSLCIHLSINPTGKLYFLCEDRNKWKCEMLHPYLIELQFLHYSIWEQRLDAHFKFCIITVVHNCQKNDINYLHRCLCNNDLPLNYKWISQFWFNKILIYLSNITFRFATKIPCEIHINFRDYNKKRDAEQHSTTRP